MRMKNKLRPRDVLITDRGNFIYCGCSYVLSLSNGELISIDTYWDKQLQYRMKFREYCQPNSVYIIEKFVKFEEYFDTIATK